MNAPLTDNSNSDKDSPAVRFARIDENRLLERLRERLPDELFIVDARPIDWARIEERFADWVEPMKITPQNRDRHAEGNVWIHSKMTASEIQKMAVWRELSDVEKTLTFLAALWHDVGKPRRTRIKDGRVFSPKHSAAGAAIVRRLLAERCGLDGENDLIEFREQVGYLVENHTTPHHFLKNANKKRDLDRICWATSPTLLAIVSEADVRGRRGGSLASRLGKVDFFRTFVRKNSSSENEIPAERD